MERRRGTSSDVVGNLCLCVGFRGGPDSTEIIAPLMGPSLCIVRSETADPRSPGHKVLISRLGGLIGGINERTSATDQIRERKCKTPG